MASNGLSGFIPIFEGRLSMMKDQLKAELSKTKSERCRKTLKRLVAECKSCQKDLKEHKQKYSQSCPHCGGTL